MIFRSADEAAVAACAWVWKNKPDATRWEYCGVIFRDAEGIKAGLPETYESASYCKGPQEPEGAIAEAGYHNHLWTEEFSGEDRNLAGELARYLCTPGRHVKKMTSRGTEVIR